ncbi:hypothetical protein GC170_00205 [bacterium]|nr:hypothetical protein [bacterium]
MLRITEGLSRISVLRTRGLFGILNKLVDQAVRGMSQMFERRQFLHTTVWNVSAPFRKRRVFEQRKYGSRNFLKDLIPTVLGSYDMQRYVDVREKRTQIGHSQEPGVDRGRVLDFERSANHSASQPEDIDSLDRVQGGFVVIQRKTIQKNSCLRFPVFQHT